MWPQRKGEFAMPRSHVLLTLVLGFLGMVPLSGTRSSDNAAGRPVLLVANKGDRSLGIVDPQSGRQVATVAEGGTTGHEVAASPDGHIAYVPIYGNWAWENPVLTVAIWS